MQILKNLLAFLNLLPDLLYADELALCGESEYDLRAMVGRFVEVCRRRGLRVSVGKSKMMVFNGEEGLESEVWADGIHLKHVSEFKYLGCVLDESGTDRADFSRKVASGRRLAGAIMSLVNARDLQLQSAKVLHEALLVYFLMYSNETMLWKKNERSRIRVVQMENLRGLLGVRRMAKVLNARIRELCGVTNGVDERIDEGVLR